MNTLTPPPTPETLRREVAALRVPQYVLAAYCRINPVTLSRILNERVPLTPETAERILAAIRTLEVQAR